MQIHYARGSAASLRRVDTSFVEIRGERSLIAARRGWEWWEVHGARRSALDILSTAPNIGPVDPTIPPGAWIS